MNKLCTSDDYLVASAEQADVYEVSYEQKKNWFGKMFAPTKLALENLNNLL